MKRELEKDQITVQKEKELQQKLKEKQKTLKRQNTWKIKGGKLGEINCENTLGGTTTSDNITECKSDSYNTPIVCTDNVTSLDSIKITECTIPVYTTNADNSKDNNNTLDDITFSFIK